MSQYMFAFIVISVLFIGAMFAASAAMNDEPLPPKELKCWEIYDVPLSEDLQIYTQELCEEYNIDFKLVLAIISVKSGFRPNAYNEKSKCCGLMQVKADNLSVLSEKLGVSNLFDSYENIMSGIYILRYALNFDNDLEHALIIYNNGLTGAKKLFYKGIHSTECSRQILEVRDNLQLRERIYEEI
jgi:soluble lytic murein transglycosylase-like protein